MLADGAKGHSSRQIETTTTQIILCLNNHRTACMHVATGPGQQHVCMRWPSTDVETPVKLVNGSNVILVAKIIDISVL